MHAPSRPRRSVRLWNLLLVGVAAALVALLAWLVFTVRAERVVMVRGDGRSAIGEVHFGGPDMPVGSLRALLLRRIRQTPPGQSIDWATYYFLDREMAEALIAASRRGVRVRLAVEGDPRLEDANNGVLALLRADGLRGGLTIRPEVRFPFEAFGGKLHAKIYAFSWPRPVVLVGSYNPSGGDSPSAATMKEIGDQDRGHNLLVEITSPGLVRALVHHVALLAEGTGRVSRFSAENNRIVADGGTRLYFYPRLDTTVIEDEINRLGPGDRLLAAVSHLKNESVGDLIDAAERGAALSLVVHDTERRVPQAAVERLRAAGVRIRRYRVAGDLPMHAKFFVIDHAGARSAFFGSLNFNRNSRLLNDELLVRTDDPALIGALETRFALIEREIDQAEASPDAPARSAAR